MTKDRLAVIDLGSNTFHLLICDLNEEGDLEQVYKSRVYVKLASGGLGYINPESEARGLKAMLGFAEKIKLYQVKTIKAVGTSALREASNGSAIAEKYFEATGISIDILDGNQEADYILGGTRAALPKLDQYGLIMDIGGGSVEFILFQESTIAFKASYKIGVSVLHKLFHLSDPISDENLQAMKLFLNDELAALKVALKAIGSYHLIGSSGSFEVIQGMLSHISTAPNWSELDIRQLPGCLEKIISLNLEERIEIKEIPSERLDYIVVAFALIQYIILSFPPKQLFYCDFALKEGVLFELATQK